MNHYRMKLGANDDQALCLQLIKQGGGDGIQISDGLCLKSPLGEKELSALFAQKGLGTRFTPVSSATPDLSPDEQTFLS